MRRLILPLLLLATQLLAGEPREDWARVTALDAGPGVIPKTPDEALTTAVGHLNRQEKALRDFLAAHPSDANAFEARLRLARVLSMRADMQGEPAPAEIPVILQKAEEEATTPARRTELDFARLTRQMRRWRLARPTAADRRDLLDQVRTFEHTHPGDRRNASLLAEVATLFEGEPKLKESLLLEAKKLAEVPELKAQIADDLKRLGFFGKVLPLRFTALDGRRVDAVNWRGKVVGLVFFATASDPSKIGFAEIQRAVAQAGAGVLLVAISLDTNRDALETFLRGQKFTGPVAWDGKGWNGPLIQALGINAVPAAWLIDRQGVVRSLDALDDPPEQIRRLLESK